MLTTIYRNSFHARNIIKMSDKVPRVVNSKEVGSTRWIRLKELEYVDENGDKRPWNMAQRTTKSQEVDGVAIFAKLMGGTMGKVAQSLFGSFDLL